MPSAAEAIALLDASLEVELRELGRASPMAEFHVADGLVWCLGAVPGAVVYRTGLDSASADGVIADRLRAFDAVGVAITWWAGPRDRPEELRRHLAAANFDLADDEAGMVADLEQLEENLPVPSGLEFAMTGADERLDERVIDEWLDVAELTHGWPPERRDIRRRLYLTDERRPRPWRHVVARLNGTPVALSRILLHERTAMVHGVATVPDSRRRGIGTAVTLRALQLGRDDGATVAVLQASSEGQGPYRRLGFQQVASYGRFIRRAQHERVAV